SIENLIEQTGASAHHQLVIGLKRESDSWRNALVLIRKLLRFRERWISHRLRKHLKVFANSEVEREPRVELEFILNVKPVIGKRERELRISSTLTVKNVAAQREICRTAEAKRPQKISREEVGDVGAVVVKAELEIVASDQIIHLFPNFKLELLGIRYRERGCAQFQESWRKDKDVGECGGQQSGRRSNLLIAQIARVKVIEKIVREDMSRMHRRMMIAHEIVGE